MERRSFLRITLGTLAFLGTSPLLTACEKPAEPTALPFPATEPTISPPIAVFEPPSLLALRRIPLVEESRLSTGAIGDFPNPEQAYSLRARLELIRGAVKAIISDKYLGVDPNELDWFIAIPSLAKRENLIMLYRTTADGLFDQLTIRPFHKLGTPPASDPMRDRDFKMTNRYADLRSLLESQILFNLNLPNTLQKDRVLGVISASGILNPEIFRVKLETQDVIFDDRVEGIIAKRAYPLGKSIAIEADVEGLVRVIFK